MGEDEMYKSNKLIREMGYKYLIVEMPQLVLYMLMMRYFMISEYRYYTDFISTRSYKHSDFY